MHRVSLFSLASLLALVGAGCDGSSKPSDRASATAPIVSAAPTVPTVRVTGRVTHQGAPLEGAFLILASKTTGEAPEVAPSSLFSDAAGAFTIDAPADVYDVLAVTTDGLVAEGTVDLTAGPVAGLDLALAQVDVDPSALGPGTLRRLLSAGPFEPDASLLTEDEE